MKFISNPNLPDKKVNGVIISDINLEIINELQNNYHIECISPSPLSEVTGSERFHADMSVFHFGNELFICDKDNTVVKSLKALGSRILTSSGITAKTPLLNACIINNRLLCNPDTTDDAIIDFCIKNNYSILPVKQKYVRCSVAIVSDNSIITSDNGIAAVCEKEKIDYLKIQPGNIKLEGYEYGFIGGCCGLIDRDLLVFSGKIEMHPDYENIRRFARNYGVYIDSLSNSELYDIGGIMPIF